MISHVPVHLLVMHNGGKGKNISPIIVLKHKYKLLEKVASFLPNMLILIGLLPTKGKF